MYTRLLVENILSHPMEFDWQVQGLGMMRIYLDASKTHRLHIWDSSLKVPGVSALHNHPWDLTSLVVAGVYKQYRYTDPVANQQGEEYNKVTIKCGEGAFCTTEPEKVKLFQSYLETYKERETYHQSASEIHWACPEDGTVTIVMRTPKADPDHAAVYWRGKGKWVSAEPRQATEEEIVSVCNRSLESWFCQMRMLVNA